MVTPECRNLGHDYEHDTIKVWLSLLEKGHVVWDIGSNIGLYTILTSRAVSPGGQVVAFEPSPYSYKTTLKHIEINGLEDVASVRRHAISMDDGSVLEFGISEDNSADPTNRLHRPGGKMIEVPVESLDGIMTRSEREVDFVKIDIEGAEMDALAGAEKLMTSDEWRPVILLAVHPMFLPEFGYETSQIADLVFDRDYESFGISGRRESPVNFAEYLLVPREKIDHVMDRLGWSGN